MIVFDLAHSGGSHRVAIVGSCRVRTPILTLKSLGRLDLAINQPALTHTFAEGRQNMRHAWGEARVPDAFAPYVFETPASPAAGRYPRRILEGIDTVVVEMCDARQIRKDEWFFQSNYFARQFVQKRAAELLDWYRAFSKGKEVTPAIIEAALAKLRAAGQTDDGTIEDILRNARLETPDRDKVIADAASIASDRSKRWVFLSHFAIPGNEGAIMADRRRLAGHVQDAAEMLGAEFFNPTRLIEHYGQEKVLRGGGTDIYEYDWPFIPVVGEIILNIVRQGVGHDLELPPIPEAETAPAKTAPVKTASGKSTAPAPVQAPAPAPVTPKAVALDQAAARVNKLLVKLHRDRLSTLGLKNSGLHDNFKTLIDAGQIVRPRDIDVVRLVSKDLPPFASYTVLKAGLGAVPLMLALLGMKSTAFEASGHRVAAIEAAASALAVQRSAVADKVRVSSGLVPETEAEPSTLCIAVGYVSRGAELEQARILGRLATFEALLIEPRTFLRHRTAANQADVMSEIRSVGFRHMVDVADGLLFASKTAMAIAAA